MTNKHSFRYINAIRTNNDKVIAEMISDFQPRIIAFLKIKGVERSTIRTADDFFLEGLMDTIDRVNAYEDFNRADTRLYYYIRRSCFNKWIDTLKGSDRYDEMINELMLMKEDDLDLEEIEYKNAEQEAFNIALEQLGQDCLDILLLPFNGVRDKELAPDLGYAVESIKQKRRKCKEKLKKSLTSDNI